MIKDSLHKTIIEENIKNNKITNINPPIPKFTITMGPIAVPIIVPTAIKAILNDMALARSSSPTSVVIHVIGVGINPIAANRHIKKRKMVKMLSGSSVVNPVRTGVIKSNSNKKNAIKTSKLVPTKPIIKTGLILQ